MTGNDTAAMVNFAGSGMGDRKVLLFACACCRRIWPLLQDEQSRAAGEATDHEQPLAAVAGRARIPRRPLAGAEVVLDDPAHVDGLERRLHRYLAGRPAVAASGLRAPAS